MFLSFFGWSLVLLSLQHAEACKLKYHRFDGATIASQEQHRRDELEREMERKEEEKHQQQEQNNSDDDEEEEVRVEDLNAAKEEIDCRECPEERSNPRFFWPVHTVDVDYDVRDTRPCCSSFTRLSNATQCGKKPTQNRILGGVIAKEHEFPWHCALLNRDGSYQGCGVILFSCDPLILVTAAHCFIQDPEPSHLMVSCGAQTMARPGVSPMDEGEVRLNVSAVVRHQDFRWLTAHSPLLGENDGHPSGLGLFENDIAVIKVDEAEQDKLQCAKKEIWPACWPTEGLDYVNWEKSGLAGWGQTHREGNVSKVLMKVDAPIVSDEYCELKVCQTKLGPIGIQNCVITSTKICAGGVPDQGPCRGDSGGALVVQDQAVSGWSAVGIVSYQPGNILEWPRCGSDKFTVFTQINKYLGWIAAQFGMVKPAPPPFLESNDDENEEEVDEEGSTEGEKEEESMEEKEEEEDGEDGNEGSAEEEDKDKEEEEKESSGDLKRKKKKKKKHTMG